MSKNKETKKELIFKVKCQLDKNGNKYLVDNYRTRKGEVVFTNIIVNDNNSWSKYPLNNFKVNQEYDIKVSGYKIENSRIALFV